MNDPAPSGNDHDLILVERTLAGDRHAYDLLVVKYRRRVERLIGRLVRDPDRVEDLAQDTFIRAYRALGQFRGEARFYTWLYRIALNTAKKALVQMRRDPLVSGPAWPGAAGEDEDGAVPEKEPGTADNPETLLAAKEVAGTVEAAMQDLPEELREAITLREIEGMSYQAIATRMKCPVGTVRSRIFRAREAISTRVRPLLVRQGGKRW